MARDWVDILRRIEAHIPAARGGANQDDVLRAALVPIANDAMAEITREQRWSQQFSLNTSITTAANTQSYSLPSNITTIARLYFLDTKGLPQELDRYNRREVQRIMGEQSAGATTGIPMYFSLEANTLYIYPCPDGNGPNGGNYTLYMECYTGLLPIIETTGSVNATLTALTVPAGQYLLDNGATSVGAAQTAVSVRGAGSNQIAAVPDSLVSIWTNINTGTNIVTLGTAAATTVVNAQTYFYSTNWLITNFSKVLQYYVLAEVSASYYADVQQAGVWKGLRDENLQKLRDYEFDRARGIEMFGVAQVGQNSAELKRAESFSTVDIRGGV